jgi:hypothetical protein
VVLVAVEVPLTTALWELKVTYKPLVELHLMTGLLLQPICGLVREEAVAVEQVLVAFGVMVPLLV